MTYPSLPHTTIKQPLQCDGATGLTAKGPPPKAPPPALSANISNGSAELHPRTAAHRAMRVTHPMHTKAQGAQGPGSSPVPVCRPRPRPWLPCAAPVKNNDHGSPQASGRQSRGCQEGERGGQRGRAPLAHADPSSHGMPQATPLAHTLVTADAFLFLNSPVDCSDCASLTLSFIVAPACWPPRLSDPLAVLKPKIQSAG